MIRDAAMKAAIVMTFAAAVAALATMMAAQKYYKLDDFQFGRWGASYSEGDIQRLAREFPDKASQAVVPILFPFDLIFLACFGSFLALCSLGYSEAAGLSPVAARLLVVIPAIYVIADFSENIFIARMLAAPDLVTAAVVGTTRWLTKLKWAAVALGSIQVMLVVGFGLFVRR